MNQILSYNAIFKNDWGESEILLCRDGIEFSFEIWGVTFEAGTDFDFQPQDETDVRLLEKFILTGLTLSNYTLDFEMPVKVLSQNVRLETMIHVQLKNGLPVGRWSNEPEIVILKLEYGEKSFISSETNNNDFYEALAEIKQQMPETDELQICFFCRNHFGREAHTIENFRCDLVSNYWVLATDSCSEFKERTKPI